MRPTRPWARLSLLGAAAHSGFELAAGSGFPLVSLLGPYGGAAAWAGGVARCWTASGRPGASGDTVAALTASLGLAGVVAHYRGWPTRPRAAGLLPWLVTAEGLSPRLMPAYNTVLLAWGTCSAVALVTAAPRQRYVHALMALSTVPLLVRGSRAEFRWMQQQPSRWWNRSVHG